MKEIARVSDDINFEMVEWVDGERISLVEYDARIAEQIKIRAGSYLRQINSDCNWIFGIS